MKKSFLTGLMAVLFGVCAQLACSETVVLMKDPHQRLIAEREISFLAQLPKGACVFEESDLWTQHAPWSTFKIPNLLIALETGVSHDMDASRKWDPARYPSSGFGPKVWYQDHTLASAFKTSAVWFFREVAKDVGTVRYRKFLRDWQYGNAVVPDGSDRFWLNEGLAISVTEQVDFLSAVLAGQLDVSGRTIDALKDAALTESSGDVSLYGKTGAGRNMQDGQTVFEGWYVGWVARREGTIPFALFATASDFSSLRDFRKAFAIRLLKDCGALPTAF